MSPTVSVIIPTYNREPLLREAIESVRAQTFTDWDLIVVDDGSTDGTGEYLQSIVDPRIRMIRLAHSGLPARARNAGLAAARGEFVAFLGSDDLWVPWKLAAQLDALVADPRARWSYTDFAIIDLAGAAIPRLLERALQRPQSAGARFVVGSAGRSSLVAGLAIGRGGQRPAGPLKVRLVETLNVCHA